MQTMRAASNALACSDKFHVCSTESRLSVRNRGTQPTVTSRHIGALVLAGLSLAACSVQQLKDNTLDIGGSVGSIYTSQIIGNLESLDRNLNAMPSLFSLSSGGIHTTNNINPSLRG